MIGEIGHRDIGFLYVPDHVLGDVALFQILIDATDLKSCSQGRRFDELFPDTVKIDQLTSDRLLAEWHDRKTAGFLACQLMSPVSFLVLTRGVQPVQIGIEPQTGNQCLGVIDVAPDGGLDEFIDIAINKGDVLILVLMGP